MQINTGDFKKGIKVLVDGDPYDMFECNFKKPGKGQALYITKLRNLLTGTILDRTYKSGSSLESADIRNASGQYLYRETNGYVFMDDDTFEQNTLSAEVCGNDVKFLLEGAPCELLYWNNQLISMTPPSHVVLTITSAEPAAKGNTATNVTKPATVETGAIVHVPAFVKEGEKIKVDARTGDYIERVRE